METDLTNEAYQIVALIEEYVRLQRIMTAADREKELDYQIRFTKVKLEVFGVDTEALDIH